jgi:translation initiation factor 3 subunit G
VSVCGENFVFSLPKEFEDLNELFEYDIISNVEYNKQIELLLNNENKKEHAPQTEVVCEEEIFNDKEYDAEGNEISVHYVYTTNEEGKTVLTIRKTKFHKVTRQITKGMKERSSIIKFGRCAGNPPGPEQGITSLGDLVFLETPSPSFSSIQSTNLIASSNVKEGMSIVCRNCSQAGHWTKDCTIRTTTLLTTPLTPHVTTIPTIMNEDLDSSKYVPPSKRNNAQSHNIGYQSERDPTTGNVRIGNLDEEASEYDLRLLFERFGNIKRINVVKDRKTKKNRGFAYVEFYNYQDALKAVEKINGHPYGNQILSVSISEPRPTNY